MKHLKTFEQYNQDQAKSLGSYSIFEDYGICTYVGENASHDFKIEDFEDWSDEKDTPKAKEIDDLIIDAIQNEFEEIENIANITVKKHNVEQNQIYFEYEWID